MKSWSRESGVEGGRGKGQSHQRQGCSDGATYVCARVALMALPMYAPPGRTGRRRGKDPGSTDLPKQLYPLLLLPPPPPPPPVPSPSIPPLSSASPLLPPSSRAPAQCPGRCT